MIKNNIIQTLDNIANLLMDFDIKGNQAADMVSVFQALKYCKDELKKLNVVEGGEKNDGGEVRTDNDGAGEH